MIRIEVLNKTGNCTIYNTANIVINYILQKKFVNEKLKSMREKQTILGIKITHICTHLSPFTHSFYLVISTVDKAIFKKKLLKIKYLYIKKKFFFIN